ncbi:hypothetical protein C7M84_009414 [Penaeus vannamei]|uniref:Uncharacterized protein n=1 Tax=Penaeus vannamei TaxID=6689 RepID=A0A423T719_PENVA|nr:hypothetical protein C7M84_009414 [Penaeus vannamei]
MDSFNYCSTTLSNTTFPPRRDFLSYSALILGAGRITCRELRQTSQEGGGVTRSLQQQHRRVRAERPTRRSPSLEGCCGNARARDVQENIARKCLQPGQEFFPPHFLLPSLLPLFTHISAHFPPSFFPHPLPPPLSSSHLSPFSPIFFPHPLPPTLSSFTSRIFPYLSSPPNSLLPLFIHISTDFPPKAKIFPKLFPHPTSSSLSSLTSQPISPQNPKILPQLFPPPTTSPPPPSLHSHSPFPQTFSPTHLPPPSLLHISAHFPPKAKILPIFPPPTTSPLPLFLHILSQFSPKQEQNTINHDNWIFQSEPRGKMSTSWHVKQRRRTTLIKGKREGILSTLLTGLTLRYAVVGGVRKGVMEYVVSLGVEFQTVRGVREALLS